ncbi:2'-hydroxyisoflavone reductase [Scheffersomyces xylosifermentans]|uniref:2'-hydroxyisoflavone reductase n=1 Tax=Scheffersomyces xylosifermentans TaxID=1304137 RepID=UPI00315D5BE7
MVKLTIAIFGVNGYLGKPFIEALESGRFDDKFQFPVKAVTRRPTPSTSKVEYIVEPLSHETVDSIADKLAGTDVILELLTSNSDLFEIVEKIIYKVRPKIFIPSQFGCDVAQIDTYAPGFVPEKELHSQKIRALGIKTVHVITSMWAVPGDFLYEVVGAVGIDTKTNTIVQIGDPQTRFSITKIPDIINSVLTLVTLDISVIPDTVRIQSDVITFQDVIDRYEATHNVKLKVVKKISKEEAAKDLKQRLAHGFNHDDLFFYLQAISAQGLDKGVYFREVHNELVNPNESLWKWEKY